MRTSRRRSRTGARSPFGRPACLVIIGILLLTIVTFLIFSDDSPVAHEKFSSLVPLNGMEKSGNASRWVVFPQPWNTGWGNGSELAAFNCKEPKYGQGGICLDRPWSNKTMRSGTATTPIAANASVQSLGIELKWVVLTYTKRAEQVARVNMSLWEGWSKVVVVHNKDDLWPHCGPDCRVLHRHSKAVQHYRLTTLLDWTHYARKMIGFLYAIEQGAHLIYQSDDNGHDNQPESPSLDWVAPLHTAGVMVTNSEAGRVVNPYAVLGQGGIFPRGYPEQEGAVIAATGTPPLGIVVQGKASTFLPIQQGVADNGVDLDPTVVNRTGEVLFRRCQPPFAPAEWTFAPVNSRHTAHYQPAFHLMYLPSSVGAAVSDIWSGYLGQRLLWDMGGAVGFIATGTEGVRTPPLALESTEYKQLWEQSSVMVDFLGGWKCDYSNTLDCALFMALQTAASGLFSSTELPLVAAWLGDLHAVGHAPVVQLKELEGGKREHVEGHLSNPIYVAAQRTPCGTYSRHLGLIKAKFRDIDPDRLCYPGNHLPPNVTKLHSPPFTSTGEALDRERPRGEKVMTEQPPQFVYLVQGDGSAAEPEMGRELCHHNAEVLMLTYETEIAEAIFAPRANWVERRNILFSAALHLELVRGWRWSYYIFLDEDTVMQGEWGQFEKFLNLVQPAVAEPYVNRSGCQPWTLEESNLAGKEHTAVYDLNPQMSAYHQQAAAQLLPYVGHYGNSVFLTQALQSHKCAVLYHGHCVQTKYLHLCRPQMVESQTWAQVKKMEDLFEKEVNVLADGREDALSCFRSMRRVMSNGSPFPTTVANKTKDYDQIDFSNAEPCTTIIT